MEPATITNAIEQMITIRDVLRFSVTQFEREGIVYGQGYDNPWDEAVALLSFVLHLPVDVNQEILDAHLTIEEKKTYFELVATRVNERIPTAYLTHQAWYCDVCFYVDERVLIPRSPIVELIHNQFEPWVEADSITRIADIGTGSGCIACACAYAFPEAMIDAVDISEDALDVAEINVRNCGLEDQIELISSNLLSGLAGRQYDLIIANIPYVDSAEMQTLAPEFRHEPRLALAAGEHGLDIVIPLLSQAANYLSEDGVLIAEVGNSEAALIEQYPDLPLTWIEFESDAHGVFLIDKDRLLQYQSLLSA